jgi:hypothetical protein
VDAVFADGDEFSGVDGWRLGEPQESRDIGPVHVGIEEPHTGAELGERHGKIDADGALAHPALATEDRDNMGNLREVQLLWGAGDAGSLSWGLGEFHVYGFDLREGFEGLFSPRLELRLRHIRRQQPHSNMRRLPVNREIFHEIT